MEQGLNGKSLQGVDTVPDHGISAGRKESQGLR